MLRQHCAAAPNRRDKTCGEMAFADLHRQCIDRRLPLRGMHFLRHAFIGDDARVVLGQGHEDKHTAAIARAANPPQALFTPWPLIYFTQWSVQRASSWRNSSSTSWTNCSRAARWERARCTARGTSRIRKGAHENTTAARLMMRVQAHKRFGRRCVSRPRGLRRQRRYDRHSSTASPTPRCTAAA